MRLGEAFFLIVTRFSLLLSYCGQYFAVACLFSSAKRFDLRNVNLQVSIKIVQAMNWLYEVIGGKNPQISSMDHPKLKYLQRK